MLTSALLLLGSALLLLVLADAAVRRLPLSPALVYLGAGFATGHLLGPPDIRGLIPAISSLSTGVEFAILLSLFAVGLRVRVPPSPRAWRVALLLAGPGLVVTIVLTAVGAHLLLGLPAAAALLLGAILGPTDPVLASEVQIRSNSDRDAVRLSLTTEGGINDGTALPAVMLALGLLGLHTIGPGWRDWWWRDLVWSIGGAAGLGITLGYVLGRAIRWRLESGDPIARDELLYVAAVALSYGIARALHLSSFVLAFTVGATLLFPLRDPHVLERAHALSERLYVFGARCERLVEAAMVLAVGYVLAGIDLDVDLVLHALLLLMVIRPLSVLAVVRRHHMPPTQRRLVAWFGIRGIGTVYYLLYVFDQGLDPGLAQRLLEATLTCVALSILLHGMSATPLMAAYHRRQRLRHDGNVPRP